MLNKLPFSNNSCIDNINDTSEHAFYIDFPVYEDVNILYCGFQKCPPNYYFGPNLKNHFYYHFVTSGSGILVNNSSKFIIEQNMGFMGFPNELLFYKASSSNPWSYLWIAFDGKKSLQIISKLGLSPKIPVLRHKNPLLIKELICSIINLAQDSSINSQLKMAGYFQLFLSELYDSSADTIPLPDGLSIKQHYINKAIYFIQTNYSSNLSVSKIADFVGLDPGYFTKVFKQYTGITPKTFLLDYRLNKSLTYINRTNYTIKQISQLVGFNDPLYFSKCFSKKFGYPPTKNRGLPNNL